MFQEGKILARYEQGNQIIELWERNLEKDRHLEPRAAACRHFPARDAPINRWVGCVNTA